MDIKPKIRSRTKDNCWQGTRTFKRRSRQVFNASLEVFTFTATMRLIRKIWSYRQEHTSGKNNLKNPKQHNKTVPRYSLFALIMTYLKINLKMVEKNKTISSSELTGILHPFHSNSVPLLSNWVGGGVRGKEGVVKYLVSV